MPDTFKSMASATTGQYPNYISDREIFSKFLNNFIDVSDNVKPYVLLADHIAQRTETAFELVLDDLANFGELELAQRISMNVLGYLDELCKVIDAFIPNDKYTHFTDPIDYLADEARRAGQQLPAQLIRRYEVTVIPLTAYSFPRWLRDLRSDTIGTLSTIRGICVSVTVIRPKLQILTLVCESCAEATFQQVIGDRLIPQLVCGSQRCKNTNTMGRLLPQYRASRFIKFQELKIQELPSDVPKGAIPRTVHVICEGEQTRITTPGQTVRIVGCYMPDPSTGQGHEAFKASTMIKTLFKAIKIMQEKRSYDESRADLSESVAEAKDYPDRDVIMDKLVHSIAPEIYGLDDVKMALLCLLVGGSNIANDIAIRSDINICLMGDPGVAKSQLLKWVAAVAPRSVFTTGKGSSGVGLTAAVTKDPTTGETVLEGGALVLADKGICCCDEFDKMQETDRTSLHEVMEQQSVSIAKAGIITTLNARTSILAASNPKYGRWRRNVSPAENVNLPPALLSRFDLLWLLLDNADREVDVMLSKHITHVHVHGVPPGKFVGGGGAEGGNAAESDFLSGDYLSKDFLRAYVGEAKRVNPVIDKASARAITEIYCEMRSQRQRQANVVTARTLLSLIRLSQALARLRFANRVQERDVREAARLLDGSKASLNVSGDSSGASGRGGGGGGIGATDAGIFTLVKDIAGGKNRVKLDDVRLALLTKGVNEQALQRCLQTYTDLGVWVANNHYIEYSEC